MLTYSLRQATSSARTSEFALKIAHRANVGIASIKLREPPDKSINQDHEFPLHCVEIVLSNNGLTDAIGMCCEFTANIPGMKCSEPVMSMATDLHRDIMTPVMYKSIGEIFPGVLGRHEHGIALCNLTLDGSFRYQDVFGSRTLVKFSARISPQRHDLGKGIPGEYTFYWTTDVKSDHEQA